MTAPEYEPWLLVRALLRIVVVGCVIAGTTVILFTERGDHDVAGRWVTNLMTGSALLMVAVDASVVRRLLGEPRPFASRVAAVVLLVVLTVAGTVAGGFALTLLGTLVFGR